MRQTLCISRIYTQKHIQNLTIKVNWSAVHECAFGALSALADLKGIHLEHFNCIKTHTHTIYHNHILYTKNNFRSMQSKQNLIRIIIIIKKKQINKN